MSFYFLMPAYGALALLILFFNIPESLYSGLMAYLIIITLPILICTSLSKFSLKISDSYQKMSISPIHRGMILLLASFILLCGPLDIYVNGFKLLNPASYTEIHGIGRYIRHFTILCWILIPLAFLLIKHPVIKSIFISYALVFPILIIDRNRVFISFYTLFLCLILMNDSARVKPSKFKGWHYLIPLLGLVVFSVMGSYRSGLRVLVPSSGSTLLLEHYPLKASFGYLPVLMQQFVLYIVTPLFNFATIVSAHFTNPDFLLSQFAPFARESFELHPYAPLLVPRFNVGTEFYPFLLYGGLPLVLGAYLLMIVSFILMCNLFKKHSNIFTFLIFIKISFLVLFMGFAPQFFILLNLMFVIVMLFLWFFAEWISSLSVFTQDKGAMCHGT